MKNVDASDRSPAKKYRVMLKHVPMVSFSGNSTTRAAKLSIEGRKNLV
jgi:hypothetical protein